MRDAKAILSEPASEVFCASLLLAINSDTLTAITKKKRLNVDPRLWEEVRRAFSRPVDPNDIPGLPEFDLEEFLGDGSRFLVLGVDHPESPATDADKSGDPPSKPNGE